MKKNIIFIGIIVLIIAVLAFLHNPSEETVPTFNTISPGEVRELLDNNEDFVLLDVRTHDEYTEGRIPGSLLIPYDEIEELINVAVPDRNKKIIVYCHSGRRSRIASQTLIDLGYRNIYDLGGINDWPFEIEDEN